MSESRPPRAPKGRGSRGSRRGESTRADSGAPVHADVPAESSAAESLDRETADRPGIESADSGEPLYERIRRRAYELFIARGGTPGSELEDWLVAERELIESRRDDRRAVEPRPEEQRREGPPSQESR